MDYNKELEDLKTVLGSSVIEEKPCPEKDFYLDFNNLIWQEFFKKANTWKRVESLYLDAYTGLKQTGLTKLLLEVFTNSYYELKNCVRYKRYGDDFENYVKTDEFKKFMELACNILIIAFAHNSKAGIQEIFEINIE
jgi:hypothetical protein